LVQSSYAAANNAIAQFVRVADDRLIALEHHLLVKQFEESCEYVRIIFGHLTLAPLLFYFLLFNLNPNQSSENREFTTQLSYEIISLVHLFLLK